MMQDVMYTIVVNHWLTNSELAACTIQSKFPDRGPLSSVGGAVQKEKELEQTPTGMHFCSI